jgi:hypothetical protein
MNAAREGVDRFGSPSLGVGASTMGGTHGRQESLNVGQTGDGVTAAGLNENLKNIGKFFRRDVGARFGMGGTSAEGR